MVAVHQFVPSYVTNTAIGTHTRELAKILRAMGIHTHAWVNEARGIPAGEWSPYQSFRGPRGDEPTWLLYQLSTGSPMADMLATRTEPLVVNYHNITPAEFFRPWEPLVTREMTQGRAQLRLLAPRSTQSIADSAYNQDELRAHGYRRSTVIPVLVDLERLGAEVDSGYVDQLGDGPGAQWLFVGRIAPNKRQDRIISALAAYRTLYDPKAHLHLVGGSSSDAYLRALRIYADRLGVAQAVTITGALSQPRLNAQYRHADVFVTLSEHEGFCVPVLEAMGHGVPVVALGATAVPATVGDAGVVLPWRGGRQPAAALVAAAVHRVLSDATLRDRLVTAGHARAAEFSIEASARQWRHLIEGLVGAA